MMEGVTNTAVQDVRTTRLVGRYDMVLMSAVLALVGIGLLLVFSTTISPGIEMTDERRIAPFLHQAVAVGIGLFVMIAARMIAPEILGKASGPALILSFGLIMAMKLIPGFATTINGSPRWLTIFGVSIQPTEFIKVIWAVYAARFVARHDSDVNKWIWTLATGLAFCALVAGPIALLPDVGSALIIALTIGMMLVAGGLNWKNIAILTVPLILALGVILKIDPVKFNRFQAHAFLDVTREGVGYQLYQAVLSIGSGGLIGSGLGHGTFHIMRHLPESESDFIMAVAAEELGFFGLMFIVLLYGILAVRGFMIARMCQDSFRRNLAFIITALISLSAVIHLCVNVALIPAKGLVCPFMSYGGTAMVVALACVGILQRLHIDATARKVVAEEFLKSYEPDADDEVDAGHGSRDPGSRE